MKTTASSIKQAKRIRRHKRIRAKVSGTALCPRLTVYRSNTAVYAQVIDDETGKTLIASDTRAVTGTGKRERARAVGGKIAELAQKNGITKVVFDRGGFLYIGVIKEVAEGARAGGLQF